MSNYTLVTDLASVIAIAKSVNVSKPVFIDIETDGLFINLVTIQIYQEDWEKAEIVICDGMIENVILANIPNWHLVGHNIAYELGTLKQIPREVDDVMLQTKYAYPELLEFSLDVTTKKLTSFGDVYNALDKKKIRKKFTRKSIPTDDMLTYAAYDVIVLPEQFYNPKCVAVRDTLAYRLNMKSLLLSARYQLNGLDVDTVKVQKEIADIIPSLDVIKTRLGSVNYNSPKQVTSALGTNSSDKDTLIELITNGGSKAELAKDIYDARRLHKRNTLLESYSSGKVFTFFAPYGTATGRFSASGGDLDIGINSQQIPRDLQYLFHKADDNTSVIHADFATAELRIAASIMREPVMREELKQGIDLHKAAAAMIKDIPIEMVTKQQRQEGKAVNFGLIFGMSAPKFVQYAFTTYGVIFTLEEAQKITKKYKDKYKAIALYHARWYKDVNKKPVESALGHRAFARRGTDAINFPTQATTAECTKLSVNYLVKKFPETIDYIFNVVHDAIYLRVPVGTETKYAEALEAAMQLGWTNICKAGLMYYKDIPMPVDIEVITKEDYERH